jgi:Ca-activated chloride channel homolog
MLNQISSDGRREIRSRRGAAHILIGVMLFTLLIVAAMSVDFAYMQLVRTELRTATDAAAKAGAEALARTQDPVAARNAAVLYASRNEVGGVPFRISASDVTLGRVTGQANGSWGFSPNASPFNSVRISAKVGNGGEAAAVPLFFASVLGRSNFSSSQQSTAGQQEVEVCLCIDRSGSMMFDMSGVDYSYPTGNPRLSNFTAWGSMWQYYVSPPHPTQSRWAVMSRAVNVFLEEASGFQYPPRTAVVTWGTDYDLPAPPYGFYPAVATDLALPTQAGFNWNTNKSQVSSVLVSRANLPVCGGTNLSAGLDRAVQVLTGPNSRPLSNKIIILMTDGQWNEGRDPLLAAQDAAAAGITVHTISMITASQLTLTQVANRTGGQYYPTSNSEQLAQAFRDIAKSLPIVLTD